MAILDNSLSTVDGVSFVTLLPSHKHALLDVVDTATLSAALTITNTATGATAQAVVADACPGCATYHSLDLSTGLFQALGNLDQGIRKYCL